MIFRACLKIKDGNDSDDSIYTERRCHYWQRLSIKSVVIILVYTPWSLKVIGSVYHTFTD